MIAKLKLPPPAEQRFRLSGIPWSAYVQFADLLGEIPIRITYDRGELELMTISREHGRSDFLLALLVVVLAEELKMDVGSGGSMTFRREDLDRGMEPDCCFWIQNEHLVRSKDSWDPFTDPPPDLMLEIEISRSLLDRMGILAALRVPEVWRYDGEHMYVHILNPATGDYEDSDKSRAFPALPVGELPSFLAMRSTLSDTGIVREFRSWVRESLGNRS